MGEGERGRSERVFSSSVGVGVVAIPFLCAIGALPLSSLSPHFETSPKFSHRVRPPSLRRLLGAHDERLHDLAAGSGARDYLARRNRSNMSRRLVRNRNRRRRRRRRSRRRRHCQSVHGENHALGAPRGRRLCSRLGRRRHRRVSRGGPAERLQVLFRGALGRRREAVKKRIFKGLFFFFLLSAELALQVRCFSGFVFALQAPCFLPHPRRLGQEIDVAARVLLVVCCFEC